MEIFEPVISLQELPETDPIEIDGIQFGATCGCKGTVIQTICVAGTQCQ